MTADADLVVVGGGIVGLACARELARRGHQVELLEADRPGHAASEAAAGMLAPLAEAGRDLAFFELCREARDLWRPFAAELGEETGIDLDLDTCGALHPVHDRSDEERVEQLSALARDHAEPLRELTAAEVGEKAPGVAPGSGALLLAGEWRVDNRRVIEALLLSARAAGVVVRSHCPVRAVRRRDDVVELDLDEGTRTAGRVVLCAGAWSASLLPIWQESGGDEASPPIFPVRGEMLAFRAPAGWRWSGTLLGGDLYAVCRRSGDLLVGATVEEVGFTCRTTRAGRERLLAWAHDRIPALAERQPDDHWAGLRPGSVDGRPLVGRLGPPRRSHLLIAAGHHRNGILLAPWTARLVAELVERPRGSPPPCVDVRRCL